MLATVPKKTLAQGAAACGSTLNTLKSSNLVLYIIITITIIIIITIITLIVIIVIIIIIIIINPHSVYPASSGGGVNMLKQMERLQVLLAEYHHDVYGSC